MLNKFLAVGLTASALLVSAQAMAQKPASNDAIPQFSAPPTIDPKGKALFAERCSGCHDQKESRAPATAYLATRLPSEIIYTLTHGEMMTQAAGLSADDITGGTFTLSNSGSFGSHLVLPIINQPQVAILSTDGVHRRPVVVPAADGSEAIAIHSVGLLAMAWDHRAFDGAYAAAFLREVKEILETRDWEAEL